jgi:ATP-dependent Clp protease adaptor protein ClpS
MSNKKKFDWEKIVTDELVNVEKDTQSYNEIATRTGRPPMYMVCLIQDLSTPDEFVVQVVETIFHKSHEEATQIVQEMHEQGEAVCGLFTRDVAETKVTQVIDMSHANKYPLKCIMFKDQEYVIKKS